MRRITLDWDFKNKLKICYYIYKILGLSFKELIIKTTRKGYHIFIWTTAKGKRNEIRLRFGEDRNHLAMDRLHFYAKQTLFNKKRKIK